MHLSRVWAKIIITSSCAVIATSYCFVYILHYTLGGDRFFRFQCSTIPAPQLFNRHSEMIASYNTLIHQRSAEYAQRLPSSGACLDACLRNANRPDSREPSNHLIVIQKRNIWIPAHFSKGRLCQKQALVSIRPLQQRGSDIGKHAHQAHGQQMGIQTQSESPSHGVIAEHSPDLCVIGDGQARVCVQKEQCAPAGAPGSRVELRRAAAAHAEHPRAGLVRLGHGAIAGMRVGDDYLHGGGRVGARRLDGRDYVMGFVEGGDDYGCGGGWEKGAEEKTEHG